MAANSAVVGVLRALLTLDTAQFETNVRKVSDGAKQMSRDWKVLGTQATQLGSSLTKTLSLPILGLGAFAFKAAADFEESFAGIRKTVDATESQFAVLAGGMRKLSREIPVNVNQLNKIGEAAGQLGIKTENIVGFTEVMAKLGVTTELSAEEAATSLAQLANITGMSQQDFDRLGSTIVALGNNFATNEPRIVDFGLRIAAAGKLAGMTEHQILAIGTAMSSVGIEAEAGGTAVQKVLNQMTQSVATGNEHLQVFARVAGMTAEQFAAAYRKDAAGAFQAFVEGLGRYGDEAFDILDKLGLGNERVIRAFLSLGGAGNLLARALGTASDAWKENTALSEEAQKRFETTQQQLTILWGRIRDVAITMGNALLPTVQFAIQVFDRLIPILESAANLFIALPRPLQLGAIALAGLAAAAGPALWVFGQLLTSAGVVAGAFAKKGIATKALGDSLKALANATNAMTAALARLTIVQRVSTAETLLSARAYRALATAQTAFMGSTLVMGTRLMGAAAAARVATVAKGALAAVMNFVGGSALVMGARMAAAGVAAKASATGVMALAASVLGLKAAAAVLVPILAAIVVGWGAWKFGGWIGDVTGLSDVVGKLSARLGEMLGILEKGTAAQYDATRAAQRQVEANKKLDESYVDLLNTLEALATREMARRPGAPDEARRRAQELAEHLPAAMREIQDITRAIAALNDKGLASADAMNEIGRRLLALRGAGYELPEGLKNIADWFERVQAAATGAAGGVDLAGESFVEALAKARAEMASLTAAQRQEIDAGRALGASEKNIAAAIEASEAAVSLYSASIKDLTKEQNAYQSLLSRFLGGDATAQAEQYARVLREVGGATMLTAAEQQQFADAFQVVIDKYRLMGPAGAATVQHYERLRRTLMLATGTLLKIPPGFEKVILGLKEQSLAVQMTAADWYEFHQQLAAVTGLMKVSDETIAEMNASLRRGEMDWAKFRAELERLEAAARAALGSFDRFFDGIKRGFKSVWEGMTNGQGLKGLLENIGKGIAEGIGQLLTGAISSLISKVVGLVTRGLSKLWNAITGGPSQAELEGRQVAANFHAGLVAGMTQAQRQRAIDMPHGTIEWRQQVVAIGDAYLATGRTMEDVFDVGNRMWRAQRQGAAAVLAVTEEINAVLEEAAQIREDANRFVAELPGLLTDVAKSGALASRELRGLIDRADQFSQTTGSVAEFIRGQLEGSVRGIDAFLKHAEVSTQQSATSLTNALIASFSELMRRGMSAREAMELMQPAIANLEAQLERAGLRGSDAWANLRQMAELATGEITGPAIAAVHGLRDALIGLHNAGLLDQEMFAGLARQAKDTYALVISEGHSHDATLRMIAPTLQTIWELQRDFGYEVDASTGALIEQAEAMGLVGKQHMSPQDRMVEGVERMVELLEQFIKMLEVDLPKAAEESARAVARIQPTAVRSSPTAMAAALSQPASTFHQGGLLTAHKGLFLSGLRSDERLIKAETGEGILSRAGMANLGGPAMLDALNSAGAQWSSVFASLGSKAMQPPEVATAPDVALDAVRTRQRDDPQGGSMSFNISVTGVLDAASVERVVEDKLIEPIISVVRGNRRGSRSKLQALMGAEA